MKAKPFPPLTADERERVAKNLGLVAADANGYAGRGMDFRDLFNEGVIGLMRAAQMFDPDHVVDGKPIKFSTYARYWIRQSIARAVQDRGSVVRVPAWSYRHANALRRLRRAGHDGGTFDEQCDRAGIGHADRAAARRARRALATVSGCLMLDTPDDAPGPEEAADLRDRLTAMRRAVETLPERDREVIRMRFGLDGEPQQTLEAVGKRVGVTRERARQLEGLALRKLRLHLEGVAGETRA